MHQHLNKMKKMIFRIIPEHRNEVPKFPTFGANS